MDIKDILGGESSYTSMSSKEKDYFIALVREEMKRREEEGQWRQIRDIEPIEDWINSDYFVGPDQKNIYPYWKDFVVDLFDSNRTAENKITNVILSGSIGVGKSCCHKKTKIPTSLGLLEIEKLYDLYHKKGKRFKVLAETGFKDCIDVYDNGVDNVYEITLASGRILRCTENHKYRIVRDGKIEWVKTKDILPNDCIVLTRKETPFGKRYFNLKDAYTLGYVLGDGGIRTRRRKNGTVFSSVYVGYQDILKDISDILKYSFSRWFGGCHYNQPKKLKNGNNYITLVGNNTSLTTKLVESGFGYSSENKGIPKFIFECRKEVIAAFIRGLMDADGTVGTNGKVDITLKSKSIIYDLASLLSMYGINYNITTRKAKGYENNTYYRLLIVNNESYIKYYENIGFLEPFKQARLKEYYNNIISGKCDRNNRMNVPDAVKVLRELDAKNHLVIPREHSSFTSFRSQDNMSLTQLKKFHSYYKDWIEQSEYLKRVCTDDIFFDTVVSISEPYEEHTYDLTIDTDHSYCFDGVISHNTVAEIIMLRKLYELSCFENINAMFQLMSKTNIMFLYFSVNQRQAERTGFGEFRALVDNSPYFLENFRRKQGLNSLLVFPEGLSFAYGSNASDSIGMSVICSMLDEANFAGGSTGASKNSDKATDLYANIVNRANSRFIMDGGINHSLNILVSSATFENSATERQIRASRNDPHTLIAAPAQWEVKPNNFSKKFFYVFKGSNYMEASIVNSTDDVNSFRVSEGLSKDKDEHQYEDFEHINKSVEALPPHMQHYFLKVPVDLRAGFEANIITSLQDIGGVSTGGSGKLFSSPMVYQECISEDVRHPFIAQELTISTGDNILIQDYLRDDFKLKYPERPRYIHIDQSFRTDSTGIASVYVDSIIEEDGVKKPVFAVDFMLRINPPKPPRKIAIYKIRNFIIWLYKEKNMNIGKLTYDIFNSEESRQILEELGINVGYQSVDRTDKAYLDLVEIMYEKRLKIYDYPILRYELLNLLHDRERRKVDHPKTVTDDGFTDYHGKGNDGMTGYRVGSKDTSDALVGAIESALSVAVSDSDGTKTRTIQDFMMANNMNYRDLLATDVNYVSSDTSKDSLIDRELDRMIDEFEMNGGYY